MVALLSMTAAFARVKLTTRLQEAAKYEIRFNMNSLSKSLDLNYDQQKAVGDIMNMFASDMTNAAAASGNERAALRKKRCQPRPRLHACSSRARAVSYIRHAAEHHTQQPWFQEVRKASVDVPNNANGTLS